MRLIFKTSSVTPDIFYVFSIILSFSTCSQSFKKIRTWEILGANVLKVFHHWFRRRESNFDAWDTLSFNSAWNNLPKSKLEDIKLCNFKMDLMKWQLNWVECNFGLKSYLRFQVSSFKFITSSKVSNLNSHCGLVRFWNHAYGFRPNCTPLSLLNYVPVKSKLKHPPPGNSPGIWVFGNFLFKFPPPVTKTLCKCPIIGPFQVI